MLLYYENSHEGQRHCYKTQ